MMKKIYGNESNETGNYRTVSPVIVSASRRTDIPAFHSDWFLDRLLAGHLVYAHPFGNGEVEVSFERTRMIVFWTKNPVPMAWRLDELDRLGIGYYFHFTLNDYEAEGLEPNLPNLLNRIDSFQHLSEHIGKERIIWRFDPLICTEDITPDILIRKVAAIARELSGYTNKLVFSFFKPGSHTKADRKLLKAGIKCRDFTDDEVEYVSRALAGIGKQNKMVVAACDEKDLSRFGIRPNKCIDDELISSLSHHDAELMDYLVIPENLKPSGQRKACGCIPSEDIGRYSTCRHHCLYCYANISHKAVEKNFRRIKPGTANLLPAKTTRKSNPKGVQDWAQKSVNCCNGCSNGCLYCYARGEAVHRFGRLTDEQWKEGAIRRKDVEKSYPKYDQTVMFPSTHDITESNFGACHIVLGKLLNAGNRVLLVSKPRPELIEKICGDFDAYKSQILFRFTIGARDDEILSFWEPGAPSFEARAASLRIARNVGFRTSVSMEPLLDSEGVFDLVEELRPDATQAIWIGTMNHAWYMKKYNDPAIDAAIVKIEAGQTKEKLQPIYDRYKDDPLIRFKGHFLKKLGLPPGNTSEEWPVD